jgi:hypothetical protein
MKVKWEVDKDNVVELDIRPFGKSVLCLNGAEIPHQLTYRRKTETSFAIPGGKNAIVSITPQFGSASRIDLRVDGQLVVPTEKVPPKCLKCGAILRPYDRFCGECGQQAPTPESYFHRRQVREATNSIWLLAGLFLVGGIIMFFLERSQAADVMAKLQNLDPSTQLKPIGGVTYTVAELRSRLGSEPWNVLIVNAVLAAIMAGLALWGRVAPLAAVMVAAATYAAVIVVGAIINPLSLTQGVYLKIITILLLFRGVRSALALRTQNV